MEATAIVSIFRQAETVFPETENYIFSLLLPTDSPLQSPQTIYAPVTVNGTREVNKSLRQKFNNAMSAAVRQLRRGYGARGTGHAGGLLERLGGVLFNFFLPPALQEAFYSLPAGLPIILTSNDGSVPWELLHDGTEFLALKHPIGRSLWGTPVGRQVSHKGRRSLLLISNPTGDLGEADLEAEKLIDEIFDPERINSSGGQRIYSNLLARPRATKFAVLQALGSQLDLIHYSGHATPGKLLLADDEVTIEEIQKGVSGQPFVFLNACWSARQTKESGSLESPELDSFVPRDFAEAFISAGAIGFIGTLWPLFDHTSREFAHLFYSYCKNGMPVGEALRQTRCKMREKWPDDPIWASFVFYGDPSLHLLPAMSQAQTRHITVLVARLQGLSGLFDSVGIEQAASMLDDLNTSIQKITQTYQGQFYAPLTGVWNIHFGIPSTDGSDCEHAIRAALKMTLTCSTFKQRWQTDLPTPLTLQVGISTERVLVQHASGARGYQITGQVERIADHLAMSSTINHDMTDTTSQIVVDEATYRLTNEQFVFDSLASSPIIEQKPLPSYRVVGTTSPPAAMTMIGREDKLAYLASFWQQVKRGRGRIVGISGDAGIGKTCLVNAFRQQINQQNESHLWIAATLRRYHQKQSYGLLVPVIRQLAQIESHDEESVQRKKINGLLAHLKPTERDEGAELLAHVIGWEIQLPKVNNLEPRSRQKRLAKVVMDVLKEQSTSQPIILLLDDLQWADDASLSILDQLMRRRHHMRLLTLLVYREDWEWPHQNQRHQSIQSLKLEELAEDACGILLANLLGIEPEPELILMILKQTGGHPLFVKEYIQLLQDNGCLIREDSGEGVLQVADLSDISPPNKVERVIQARFDQLTDSASQVIQNASVIGEQFEEELLEKIQDQVANESLEDDLDLLGKRRMIEILGGTPFVYRFSHGLVQEIVYQLLPEPLQRATHRFVAQALRQLYGDNVDIYRLAHHYYYSNDHVNAIDYALQAAKRDANQWANQTAVEWYERALEKIETITTSPPPDAEKEQFATPSDLLNWQIEALEGQADVQKVIGHTDDAIERYTQALELITTAGSVTRRANLYHKLATAHQNKGQFDNAQNALNKGLALLDGQPCLEAGRLHIQTGLIHYRHGRLSDGLLSCEQGMAIIQETESIGDLAQAYNLQGILYQNLAQYQQAINAYEQSGKLYKQAEDLSGQERASFNLACVYDAQGRWQEALEIFQQCSDLSHRIGNQRRQAAALNSQGEIYRRQGKLEEAICVYNDARQIVEALDFGEFVGIVLMNLGASYLSKGELAFARSYLSESLALFERLEANLYLPEAFCWLAELNLYEQQPEKSKQLAEKAIKLCVQHYAQEGPARRRLGQAYRALGQLVDAATELEHSLELLEKQNNPFEIGLTQLELGRLRQAQSLSDENNHAVREQATLFLSRAITIFEELGATIELKRAQEIKSSLQ